MPGSLRGLRLENELLSGALNAAQLEARLADPLWLGPYEKMIRSKGTVKELADDPTAAAAILGSDKASNSVVGFTFAKNYFLSNANAYASLLKSDAGMAKYLAYLVGADYTQFANCANLIGNGTVFPQIAASATATAELFKNTVPSKIVLTNSSYYNTYKGTPANYTILKNQVNATGSKLKRQLITASGTWTPPTNGMSIMTVVVIGPGGNGGPGTQGGGGAGGAVTFVNLQTGLPTGAVTVLIPVLGSGAGSQTQFGSIASANAGGNGASGGIAGVGTGATTNGGSSSITDTDIVNSAWQLNSLTNVGANGGGASTNGSASFAGNGGTGGAAGGSAATNIAAGGGGGGTSVGNGTSATSSAYGAGGGGGGSATGTAGSGGPGVIILYWLEN
jgi:hypothetical protein